MRSNARNLFAVLMLVMALGCNSKDQSDNGQGGANSTGGSLLDSIDSSYITDDHWAAIVVRPRQALASEALEPLKNTDIFDKYLNQLDDDGQGIDSAVVLLGHRVEVPSYRRSYIEQEHKRKNDSRPLEELLEAATQPVMNVAVVVRYSEAPDQEKVVDRLLHGKERTLKKHGEKEYWSNDYEGVCFADDRTLIYSDATSVENMLSSESSDTPLKKVLAGMPAGHDLAMAVVSERTREIFENENKRDEDVLSFTPLFDHVTSAWMTADVGSPTTAEGVIQCRDKEVVPEVEKLISKLRLISIDVFEYERNRTKKNMDRWSKKEAAHRHIQLLATLESLLKDGELVRDGDRITATASHPTIANDAANWFATLMESEHLRRQKYQAEVLERRAKESKKSKK